MTDETPELESSGGAVAVQDEEKRELARHPEQLPMLPGELKPHPTPRQYVLIAVVLVVITGIEVGTSYLNGDMNSTLLIVLLVVMAAIKFFLVVSWYMHLRTDLRIFRRVFVVGLFLAGTVFMIALTTLHVFNTGVHAR